LLLLLVVLVWLVASGGESQHTKAVDDVSCADGDGDGDDEKGIPQGEDGEDGDLKKEWGGECGESGVVEVGE
jgi:hypothetical protein